MRIEIHPVSAYCVWNTRRWTESRKPVILTFIVYTVEFKVHVGLNQRNYFGEHECLKRQVSRSELGSSEMRWLSSKRLKQLLVQMDGIRKRYKLIIDQPPKILVWSWLPRFCVDIPDLRTGQHCVAPVCHFDVRLGYYKCEATHKVPMLN
jgi:hypothetical protein